MSLSAVPSTTLERERLRALVALEVPRPAHQADAEPRSDRCQADWRRPGGYWACVRKAGHRGRHWMRGGTRAA